MKSSHWAVVLLLLGLVVGFAVGGGVMERQAMAQAEKRVAAQTQTPRYQISAWGMGYPKLGGNGDGERGCYIVDTVTGEMWHVAADGSGGIPKKIGQKLQ